MSSWYKAAVMKAAAPTGTKRPRGRPRKQTDTIPANASQLQSEPLERAVAASPQTDSALQSNAQNATSAPQERITSSTNNQGNGIASDEMKRPRGRPRKLPIEMQLSNGRLDQPSKRLIGDGQSATKHKYVRKKPVDSWLRDPERRLAFFNSLGQKLGISRMEDWYKVQWSDFIANGGEAMLRTCYDRSIPTALKTVYPTHQWNLWLFSKVPRRFWDSALNQRQFFDWLGKKLQLTNGLHGWYSVSLQQICDNGGSTLMAKYNNSLWRALNGIYPIHPWQPWKFEGWSGGMLPHLDDQRLFFDSVARRLGMTSLKDWYQQDAKNLGPEGGYTLIQYYYNGSLPLMLEVVYPEHTWNKLLFKNRPHGSFKAFLLPDPNETPSQKTSEE